MINILHDLIDTYLNLYRISLTICCLFLWVVLSYVDRIHLRERARRFGLYISSIIAYLLVNTYIYDKFRVIVVRPLCTIFETIIGFLEGIEKFEAVILLSDNNDRYLRDDVMDKNHEQTPHHHEQTPHHHEIMTHANPIQTFHHVTEIKEDNNTHMDQNKTEKICDIDQPVVSDDEKSDDLCSRGNDDVFTVSKEKSVLAKIDNNDDNNKEVGDIHSESESRDMSDSEDSCKVTIKVGSKDNLDTKSKNENDTSKYKEDDGVNKRKKVPIRLVRRKYQN
jgi:hypothetical protein